MSDKAHIKQNLVVITILCLALELCPPAYAGTVWDGGGGNTNINTANNWDDNINPAFNGTQTVTIGTGCTSATINTNVSFMGLTFNHENDFTIAAGAGNLTIPRTYTISEGVILGADQTWTATNNDAGTTTLTVSGGISGVSRNLTLGGSGTIGISGLIGTGTGALIKTGTGALTLTRANTYTGGTMLASGTLLVGNKSFIGHTMDDFRLRGDINGHDVFL